MRGSVPERTVLPHLPDTLCVNLCLACTHSGISDDLCGSQRLHLYSDAHTQKIQVLEINWVCISVM